MVKVDGAFDKLAVSADGNGMVGLAGAGLLALCADRVGLTGALSRALLGMRRRRGRHDPGRVVRDLALVLASGGDGISDMAVRTRSGGCCLIGVVRRGFRVRLAAVMVRVGRGLRLLLLG